MGLGFLGIGQRFVGLSLFIGMRAWYHFISNSVERQSSATSVCIICFEGQKVIVLDHGMILCFTACNNCGTEDYNVCP